jgi:hypothetical protein
MLPGAVDPRQRRGVLSAPVAAVLLLCATACTTWVEAPGNVPDFIEGRRPSLVRITTTQGQQVIIEAPVILGDSLTGPEGEDAVAVPLAGVQRVESRALHPGAVLMSVFVIAGTVVGFVLVDDGGDAPLD